MPPAPTNLLTTPTDVMDYLGTDATALRLDDHHLSTGQTITVVADAAISAASLSVMPLSLPLLRGTTLQFDGGGNAAVAQAVLTAVAAAGSTSLAVSPLAAAVNAGAAAADSGVNVALAARLSKACSYGTGQVKLYCLPRYDEASLVASWSVNRWATTLAARWLCKRLCRTCPQSVESDWEEAMEELKGVRAGQLNVEDVGPRTSGWPFVTNVTVDVRYTNAKVRVQPSISEGTPTQYPQFVDWSSIFQLEY